MRFAGRSVETVPASDDSFFCFTPVSYSDGCPQETKGGRDEADVHDSSDSNLCPHAAPSARRRRALPDNHERRVFGFLLRVRGLFDDGQRLHVFSNLVQEPNDEHDGCHDNEPSGPPSVLEPGEPPSDVCSAGTGKHA